jgi:adenylyl-sulfate kinase
MDGCVVWLTGLPSAGKTTLARLLEQALRARGQRVEVLDGDEVRRHLTQGLGFSKAERDEHIRRLAFLARLLARHRVVTIAAVISPYRAGREAARWEIGRFVEVYVKCPLEVCMQRDVKGHYRRALAGELAQFTGISDPYEEPVGPEVVIETDRESPQAGVAKILERLEALQYLPAGMAWLALPAELLREVQAVVGQTEAAGYVAEVVRRALRGQAPGQEVRGEGTKPFAEAVQRASSQPEEPSEKGIA